MSSLPRLLSALLFMIFMLSACVHVHTADTDRRLPADMPKWKTVAVGAQSDTPSPQGGIADEDIPDEDVPGFDEDQETVADPVEPFNRAMFTFNDRLFLWVLKPAVKGYNSVLPESVRQSIRNFFYNVLTPVRFVNAALQGNFIGSGNELARFGINSTLGLVGFFDVAKTKFKIEPAERDLGLTLGTYGIGDGLYLVWPFLGPSSLRDSFGTAGDVFLSPLNYVSPIGAAIALDGYDYFNRASFDLSQYEDIKESSIEPYIALRDAYIQHRRSLMKGKKPETSAGWVH